MSRAPASGFWGQPVSGYSAVDGGPGSQPAGRYETEIYMGRGKLCMGNDNTCKAYRKKGSVLCNGHLLEQQKRAALQPPTEV